MGDSLEFIRIEQYANNVIHHNLSPDEKNMLDIHLNIVLEKNVYANYFLCYLNYKMFEGGTGQLRLDETGFVSLKDKFLKILSGIDSNDIRISNAGLLIHNASRIYFVTQVKKEPISLLEHLECPTLKQFKAWEIYFLYRINKNTTQLNVCSKQHFLCSFTA
jgi:hypothetical protein